MKTATFEVTLTRHMDSVQVSVKQAGYPATSAMCGEAGIDDTGAVRPGAELVADFLVRAFEGAL